MKRKDYQKPTAVVVEVKQQQQLLTGSGLGDPSDYPDGGDPLGF